MRRSVFAQVRAVNRRTTVGVGDRPLGSVGLCTTAVDFPRDRCLCQGRRRSADRPARSFAAISVHCPWRTNCLVRAGFHSKPPGCPQACPQGVHNVVACPPHQVSGYAHDLWITCSSWLAGRPDGAYVGPRCQHADRRGVVPRELSEPAPTVRTCMLLVLVEDPAKEDVA